MGANVSFELISYGFYPAGGGKIKITTKPSKLNSFSFEKTNITASSAEIYFSNIPFQICSREREVISKKLNLDIESITPRQVKSVGPGNIIIVHTEGGPVNLIFSETGKMGVSAEKVAGGLAEQVHSFLESGAYIDEYLADNQKKQNCRVTRYISSRVLHPDILSRNLMFK